MAEEEFAKPTVRGERAVQLFLDMFPETQPTWPRERVQLGADLAQLLAQRDADPAAVPTVARPYEQHERERQEAAVADFFRRQSDGERNVLPPPVGDFDYFDMTDLPDANYRVGADTLLLSKFRLINKNSLREVALFHRYHYAPTYYSLRAALASHPNAELRLIGKSDHPFVNVLIQRAPAEAPRKFKLRVVRSEDKRQPFVGDRASPELQAEVKWILEWAIYQANQRSKKYHEDKERAVVEAARRRALSEASERRKQRVAEALAQAANMLKCPVCWVDETEDETSACERGHRICNECLAETGRLVSAGLLPAPVCCVETDCDGAYERQTLETLLGADAMTCIDQLDRLVMFTRAGIRAKLERCPHCDCEALLDFAKQVDKVFRCPNADCLAQTCRLCLLDWDEQHQGLPCIEMVVDAAQRLERERVEALAKLLHKCPGCHVLTEKTDGCNHIKCTCGDYHWCYFCGVRIGLNGESPYKHFCKHQHGRQTLTCPQSCGQCMLWLDMAWYDKLATERIEDDFKRRRSELCANARTVRRERWPQHDIQPPAYGPSPPAPPTTPSHPPVLKY